MNLPRIILATAASTVVTASAPASDVMPPRDPSWKLVWSDEFEGDRIELVTGADVVVTTRQVLGRPGLIPSQYAALHRDVRPGARILLDDGNLELRVESIHGEDVHCHVIQGGVLKNKKGINLPDVAVSAPALTAANVPPIQAEPAAGDLITFAGSTLSIPD